MLISSLLLNGEHNFSKSEVYTETSFTYLTFWYLNKKRK